MTAIYIGVGVFVVLIVLGLGAFRWSQQQRLNAAYATPKPIPTASGAQAPIQLVDGIAMGTKMIATSKQGTDTPKGGVGQPVDGISCGAMEYATLHVHPHLAIFFNGKQVQVPQYIGIVQQGNGGCLYWIHTHDASGIIHVEAPTLAPPGGSGYTLGMLFDIWGQALTPTNVAGLNGPVTAYVNGLKYDGDMREIPLMSHNQITLEVGKVVPPPTYLFPPNE